MSPKKKKKAAEKWALREWRMSMTVVWGQDHFWFREYNSLPTPKPDKDIFISNKIDNIYFMVKI